MLHLHRFHHEDGLARAHRIARLYGEADDGALQRRAQFGRALAACRQTRDARHVLRRRACRAPAPPADRRCRLSRRRVRMTLRARVRRRISGAWRRRSSVRDVLFHEARVLRRQASGGAAGSAGTGCWSAPLRSGIRPVRDRPCSPLPPAYSPACARSVSPAANRSARWCDSRHSRNRRRARRAPMAAHRSMSVPPAGREEPSGVHRFEIDAGLKRRAARAPAHPSAPDASSRERRAARDFELDAHEIEPGHLLGDRVLHLQARIGFDEGEAIGAAGIDQEFDGAEIFVVAPRWPSAIAASSRRWRSVSGSPSAGASFRSVSAAGAAGCIRDPIDERPRPCRRPRSALRYGARARRILRHRARHCRTRPALRSGSARRPARVRLASRTTRMPRPPPPASALSMIGPLAAARNFAASSSEMLRRRAAQHGHFGSCPPVRAPSPCRRTGRASRARGRRR